VILDIYFLVKKPMYVHTLNLWKNYDDLFLSNLFNNNEIMLKISVLNPNIIIDYKYITPRNQKLSFF